MTRHKYTFVMERRILLYIKYYYMTTELVPISKGRK